MIMALTPAAAAFIGRATPKPPTPQARVAALIAAAEHDAQIGMRLEGEAAQATAAGDKRRASNLTQRAEQAAQRAAEAAAEARKLAATLPAKPASKSSAPKSAAAVQAQPSPESPILKALASQERLRAEQAADTAGQAADAAAAQAERQKAAAATWDRVRSRLGWAK
jgi:hypothetical protein